jgi:hypothetical protein
MITKAVNVIASLKVCAQAVAVVAGLTVSACAVQNSTQQQIEPTRPSIIYTYRNDQGLVLASQNATAFCDRRQSIPQSITFSSEPGGRKAVIFECVLVETPAALSPLDSSDLTYDYRSDQDLLNVSRNAHIQCKTSNSQRIISSAVHNVEGTKTVSFQCAPMI